MRPTFFLAALAIFLGVASATDYNVINPWGNTTWVSGSSGQVVWTVLKGDSSQPTVTQCNIDLMRGNFSNADVVAHIASSVSVNAGKYVWQKLPDYAAGSDYFVRVGTDAWWRYSHSFTYVGNGTVQSLAIPAPSLNSNGAASTGPDNSTSTSSTPDSSTSGAANDSTTGGSGSSGSSASGSSSTSSSTTSGGSNSTSSNKSSDGFTNQANFVLSALGLVTLTLCTL